MLVAVSGGVDSMVLADLFYQSGISFVVAHCNFMLRGAEANKDEELVIAWCRERGVMFHVNHFQTGEIAASW